MAKIALIIKKYSYQLGVVLICLVLAVWTLFWFRHNTIIYFHDEVIPLNPTLALRDYFYAWRADINLGEATAAGIPKIIPLAVFYLLYKAGANIQTTEKILYFSLTTAAFTSSYILFAYLNNGGKEIRDRITPLVGSVFYVLSPFLVFYLWRLNYIVTRAWFFAFMPLALFAFAKSLDTFTRRSKTLGAYVFLFAVSILLASPSFSHPSFVIMAILLLGMQFIIELWRNKGSRKRVVSLSLVLFLIFGLLNLYWALPRLGTYQAELQQAANLGIYSVLEQNSIGLTLAKNGLLTQTTVINAIIPWYAWQQFYNSSAFLVLSAFFLFFLFSAALRPKKGNLITAASFVIFSFLMVGLAPPFTSLKSYLYLHVSALDSFRDPGKWGFLLIIISAYLVGNGASYYYHLLPRKALRIAMLLSLLLLVVASDWPYFALKAIPGKLVYPSAQIQIPSDYYAASSLVSGEGGIALQLPLHGSQNFATWPAGMGYKGVDVLGNLSGEPLINLNQEPEQQELFSRISYALKAGTLSDAEFDNLLKNLNVHFIVINKDSDKRFVADAASINQFSQYLKANSQLTVLMDTSHIELFSVKGWNNNTIFAANNISSTNKNQNVFEKNLLVNSWEVAKGFPGRVAVSNKSIRLEASLKKGEKYTYIKNSKALNLDPTQYPYIKLRVPNLPSSVKLAISAEDGSGSSEWLNNVKPSGGSLAGQQGDYLYSLADFTKGIQELRINVYSETTQSIKVSITQITGAQGLYNDYATYKLVDLNSFPFNTSGFELHSLNHTSITYRQQNPSKYTINAATKSDFVVGLKQNFDRGWQLNVIGPSKSLKINNHFLINGISNGWYVDVNSLCRQQNLCHKNPDGSYDLDMQVEFTPQRWFYVGSIISGITLLGCIGYLGYSLIRRRSQT